MTEEPEPATVHPPPGMMRELEQMGLSSADFDPRRQQPQPPGQHASETPPSGPQPAGAEQPYPPGQEPAAGLTAQMLLRPRPPQPPPGWRRLLHRLSGGRINLGHPADRVRLSDVVARLNVRLAACHRLAIVSVDGGVGKTSTATVLGHLLASHRRDHVIVVDANPAHGTLALRVRLQTAATMRDLLDAPTPQRYSDVYSFTSQTPSRLEILVSEPRVMPSRLSEEEYYGLIRILERFYLLILTDCGAGLTEGVARAALNVANSLVFVTSPSLDAVHGVRAGLDWLWGNGYGHLVDRAVVVVSSVRPGLRVVDVNALEQDLQGRCRAVIRIPYDEHLAEGGLIDMERLHPSTRDAYLRLAVAVADGLQQAGMMPGRPPPGPPPRQGPRPG